MTFESVHFLYTTITHCAFVLCHTLILKTLWTADIHRVDNFSKFMKSSTMFTKCIMSHSGVCWRHGQGSKFTKMVQGAVKDDARLKDWYMIHIPLQGIVYGKMHYGLHNDEIYNGRNKVNWGSSLTDSVFSFLVNKYIMEKARGNPISHKRGVYNSCWKKKHTHTEETGDANTFKGVERTDMANISITSPVKDMLCYFLYHRVAPKSHLEFWMPLWVWISGYL